MAKELTVAEKLKQLYELQLIDSEIDQIEILKGELPMEVSDLEDDIVGLQTRIQKIEAQAEELEKGVNSEQAKIKEAETLIERYTKQMDNVKNNREYEALMKEQELQGLEIQLADKKIRGLREEISRKEESLATAKEKLASKNKNLEIKKVELTAIISKTEKEEAALLKESEKKRKKIEDRLLKAYDKIRETYRNGMAVVTVERDACGGCFNQIPPQLQLEIGLRKKIIVCEHCGRILVDDAILEAAQPENA
jgi:predicted  nucleic acid-binding Zn-ribbon protein